MKNKNICIITPAPLGPSETFLQAHIERVEGNIFHLCGYYLQYHYKGKSLKEICKPKESKWQRLFNLLPYYFVFRRNQKHKKELTDFYMTKRFMIENKIDVVLAEYGTTGAFITPVCRSLGIPLIVHFHGFDASRYKILEKFRDSYRFMFEYARNIIAVSTAMKVALVSMGCPEEKVIINTYGPHPDFFDIQPDYHSEIILAVGRQTFKKAPYLTILAFQKVLEVFPDLKPV